MSTRDSAASPLGAARATRAPHIGLGSLSVVPIRESTDPLVTRLALDRIRELRDDGVTTEYIGRMYGVTGDRVQKLEEELRRSLNPL